MTERRRKPPSIPKKGRKNAMKKFIKFVKSLLNGDFKKAMVDEGVLDFSGQGRDKYGK
jgi:hypothetical protein